MKDIYEYTYFFKVGDYVSVIDENITGVIVKIVGSKVWILTESEFEYCYEAKELIRGYNNFFNELCIPRFPPKINKIVKTERNHLKKRKERILEVDLHIEKLLNYPKEYEKREWLPIQIIQAKKILKESMKRNLKQLIFIHGQGEGILKKAVHELLDAYPNIEYFDAHYRKYGVGATEVYIHYKKQICE